MASTSHGEMGARAYCRALGLDPDEEVWGYFEGRYWVRAPRWAWYRGTS